MRPLSVRSRALAPVLLLLTTALTGCSLPDAASKPDEPGKPGSGGPGDEVTDADFEAIGALLDVRADALVNGRRKKFLSTLDPGNDKLRRNQAVLFDNLQKLPIDKLYYGMSQAGLTPGKVSGDDPVVAPPVFEHLELGTVFAKPVSNQVVITFVKRDGRWLVGAERVDKTFQAQERPWFGVPIEAAARDDVLVLTDEDADIGAGELLDSTLEALTATADVLDEPDDRPLLVDATTNGLATELSSASGEDAGAVSFGVFATNDEGDEIEGLAGSVVKANPDFVDQLVEDGRTLRHELTHFLLDGYGDSNPLWVTEGIAEYVGYFPLTLADSVATDDRLLKAIDERPVELTSAGKWGNDPDLDYLTAEAFAEHLISTFGLAKYRQMMDVFKRKSRNRGVTQGEGIVDDVLQQVYGVSPRSVAEGGFALLRGLAG